MDASISGGFTPTLATAFISIAQDRTEIAKLLDEKDIVVFGCTTNGEFIDEEPEM